MNRVMDDHVVSMNIGPAQFETVLDSVSDAVFTVDRAFRITYFNRTAERVLGVSRAAVLGRYCYDVFRSPACHVDCPVDRAFRSGQATTGCRLSANHDRPAAPVQFHAAPLFDAAGNVVGVVEASRVDGDAAPDARPPGQAAAPRPDLSILAASERQAIEAVLREHRWNQVAASRILGISRTTLWRKMRKLGIRVPRLR